MSYFTPKTFQFLKDLSDNNSREWFKSNQDRYRSMCGSRHLISLPTSPGLWNRSHRTSWPTLAKLAARCSASSAIPASALARTRRVIRAGSSASSPPSRAAVASRAPGDLAGGFLVKVSPLPNR